MKGKDSVSSADNNRDCQGIRAALPVRKINLWDLGCVGRKHMAISVSVAMIERLQLSYKACGDLTEYST